jgi:hypothetical protein
MPTYFYINTTKCIKKILSKYDKNIDQKDCANMFRLYIEGTCPIHSDINIVDEKEKNKCGINDLGECNDETKITQIRVNHILSCCVNSNSKALINILIKLCEDSNYPIDLNINHGNEYTFIQLVIDNIDEYEWTLNDVIDMITLLNNLAKDLDQNIIEQMNFASRRILSQRLLSDSDRIKLIDQLISYEISLWNLYHYSLCWKDYTFVTEHLVDNYYNKIDFEWTQSALEIAKRFGNYDESFAFAKRYGLINKKYKD